MKLTTLGCSTIALTFAFAAGCATQQEPAPAPTPPPPVVAPPTAAAEGAQAAPSVAAPASDPPKAAEPAPPAPMTIKDVGLATPESILYDADADVYLVSNINGSPGGKDDNGFISRIAPDGSVQSLKWIDGAKKDVTLNAPKGMTIVKGLLYVADIDTVRIFDAKTGVPQGKVGIPHSTFLNDVASGPDGSVYVTDSGLKVTPKGFEPSGTDAVYKIGAHNKVEALIQGASLNRPNGIFVDDSGVWVVTFGAKELFRVANGEKNSTVELPAGSLDGLIRLADGGVLVSSWDSSTVYYGKDGKFTAVVSNAKSPADIGYDSKRSLVLVPLFLENALLIQKLELPAKAP